MRPDDQAGACDRGALAEDLLHDTLRADLQAAVLLRVERVRFGIRRIEERRALVDRLRRVGVHRDRGHEDVVPDVDRFRAPPRLARQLCRVHVDRGVPLPSVQGLEVLREVELDRLHVRIQIRIRPAAVDERDVVRAGRFDDAAAEELRSPEDDELHAA